MINTTLKVKRLYDDAKLPFKKRDSDIGWDVYVHRVEEAGDYLKIYTGIAIEPEPGFYYLLYPRSSTYKTDLDLSNCVGVIDPEYRGELLGIFRKLPGAPIPSVGDRLLQLVPQQQIINPIVEVNELNQTERGINGHGSSGK